MLGLGPISLGPVAANQPPGAVSVEATAEIIAPAATLSGASFAPRFIVTDRPPVSLKEAARASTDSVFVGDWATVVQVPQYLIPATPDRGQRLVDTAVIVSRATAVAVDGSPAEIGFRVVDLPETKIIALVPSFAVAETEFTDLPIADGILGPQQVLQVRSVTGGEVHVTLSYVSRTQEEFDVVA
jgi:hypothetical protein